MSEQFEDHYEALDNHLDKLFDQEDIRVFHEIVSCGIHLDVYQISPQDQGFKILLTSGMSSLRMNAPPDEEEEDLGFAKLMMLVPREVEFGQVYPSTSCYAWMITALKETARLPHDNDTWLGIGHTVQHDADLQPYGENTKFCGGLILPSVTFEEDFTKIPTKHGVINVYSFFPLYREEIEYKIAHGYNQFIELLIKENLPELVNVERKSLIKE
jgi:hypothetical protein